MGKKRNKKAKKGRRRKYKKIKGELPIAISSAFNEIKLHPAIVSGSLKGPLLLRDGIFRIEGEIEVSLPSRSRTAGKSCTGVKRYEKFILDFPRTFPYHAPTVKLRKDFNRSLPHINPCSKDSHVYPCLYEGDINELIHQYSGIYVLIDQLAEWLKRAAADQLVDYDQGWEPIRRDNVKGLIIFDINRLRKYVSTSEGLTFFCKYYRSKDEFVGYVDNDRLSETINDKIPKIKYTVNDGNRYGLTIGIFVWPSTKNKDGSVLTTDKYLPETVTNLSELLERAGEYGCYNVLWERLQEIYLTYTELNRKYHPELEVVVILCARRPCKLINEDSSLELIPYLIICRQGYGFIGNLDLSSPVYPLGHIQAISSELLMRMSGGNISIKKGPIVQIGCGSIGSKIVLHLARAGYGPFILIDKDILLPHNAARHALIDIQEFPLRQKADALKDALSIFPQTKDTKVITDDIISLLHDNDSYEDVFPHDTCLIIDSTASIAVREVLSLLKERVQSPIMSTILYANGECGVMCIEGVCIEGVSRNPRVDDLMIKVFDHTISDESFRTMIKASDGSHGRVEIGQGCGSHTMVMPDTRVSLYAAAMAERARQLIEKGFSGNGEVLIGKLTEDGLGVTWQKIELAPTTVLEAKNVKDWEVRILADVVDEIKQESLRYGTIETGGVLIGRTSYANRCITVSRVLPAPPDSKRSETEFILGTEGLKDMIENMQESCGNLLYYVGTWHSHPFGGWPSTRDHNLLKRMKELRLGVPAVCLVWTLEGFYVLIDEGDFGVN